METPSLQRSVKLVGYVLAGVIAAGALLDAYNNASVIPPWLTYAATVLGVVSWLYLRLRPFKWTFKGNQYLIRKIGVAPTLTAAGVILTLWMPRVAEELQPVPPGGCQESTWTAITEFFSPQSSKKVVIAVADFQGPDEKHTLTPTVINRLKRATKEFPEVTIVSLHRVFKEQAGRENAREEARKCNASLVLWGFYDEALSGTVHIELMRTQRFLFLGEGRELDFSVSIAEKQGLTVKEALTGDMSLLALLVVGLARYEVGDDEGAILRFTKALEQPTTGQLTGYTSNLHYFRGTSFLSKLDYDRALADFDRAIALDSTSLGAYNNRGLVYIKKGDYSRAKADYDHVIAVQPDSTISYLNLGVIYMNEGDHDRAIINFNQAISLQPEVAEAYFNRGLAYANKGNHEQAIINFNQGLALKPNIAEAYFHRGYSYAQTGDYDRALADYNRAIALKQNYAKAYIHRGNIYSLKKDYDRAIINFNQAISLQPEVAEAYYDRGLTYWQKRDYDLAITDYDRAIALKQNYAEAYYYRGLAYAVKGNYEQAIINFNHAISLQSDFTEAYTSLAKVHSNQGLVYLKEGDYDRALADFDRAIALRPDIADLYFNRGLAYSRKGEMTKAIADYRKSYKMTEDPSTRKRAFDQLQAFGASPE